MLRNALIAFVAAAVVGVAFIPTESSAAPRGGGGFHRGGGGHGFAGRGFAGRGFAGRGVAGRGVAGRGFRRGSGPGLRYGLGVGVLGAPYVYDPYYYDPYAPIYVQPAPIYVEPPVVYAPSRAGQCWVATDKDRGFGYWQAC